ncbi:MAG TPA: Mu transposase C-terminal domain-containing protein [Candidatus Cloacimonadota bacterium]|nr:Mu transposase C-terminal domain-containing protein [Candidatus Cloacimonadota bacterium]
MVDYQLDLDEYRKFYAELMNQSDEGNDSDNVGSSAAYALEQPNEMIAGESAVEVTVSKPSLPLQERDLDLRPQQHIPYKKTQEAKLMAGFCQITMSRLDDCESKIEEWQRITQEYNQKIMLPELYALRGKRDERSLRRWVQNYQNNDNDMYALVRKSDPNGKTRKVTYFEQNYLINLLLNPNKIKIGSAITILKGYARLGLCESPSDERTLRRFCEEWLRDNPAISGQARQGSKFVAEHIVKTIMRDSSLLKVGDVWVADGHTLAFDIINPQTGKAQRMTMIMVFDWASRYPVGASLALTEDSQHIQAAFRNGFLNWGALPKFVYLDNGKAFKSKLFHEKWENHNLETELGGIFPRLKIEAAFAESYNAKAKVIERFFKTFQDQFERFLSSFRGSCVADKPSNLMRNEKWARSLFESKPPTLNEAMQMIAFYIRYMYGEAPHSGLDGKSPWEVFSKAPLPEDRKVIPSELNFMMLAMEKKKIRNEGIRFNKLQYWDIALVDYVGKDVVIRYDYADARWILVYDLQDRFICQAALRRAQHPFIHLDKTNPIPHTNLNKEHKQILKLRRTTEQRAKFTVKQTQAVVDQFLKPLTSIPEQNTIFIQPPMIEAPKHEAEEFMQALEKQVIKNLPPLSASNINHENPASQSQFKPDYKPVTPPLLENDDDEIKPRKKTYEEMLRFIGIK